MTGRNQNAKPRPARDLRWLHGAVLLFGLAGVLGKMTAATAVQVTFVRAALAATVLGLALAIRRRRFQPLNSLVVLSGLLLAVHWWTFFQSIETSSVGLALLSFGTFPVFVTLLGPLHGAGQWRGWNLVLAGAATVGIAVLAPSFDVGSNAVQGIGWGVLSAALFAQLSLLNRRLSARFSAVQIGCVQNGIAALGLSAWGACGLRLLSGGDWAALLVLGVVCTAIAHLWYIRATASASPVVIGTTVALEPVYGILFAMVLLREYPVLRTVMGGAIILTVAVTATLENARHAATT